MQTTFSNEPVHEYLEQILDALDAETVFDLRAVLVAEQGGPLRLLSCVVRPQSEQQTPVSEQAYATTILVTQTLQRNALIEFLANLSADQATIGKYALVDSGTPQWELRPLPAENPYMEAAGWVAIRRLPDNITLGQQPLARPGMPYYADDADAVGEWSRLRVSHGNAEIAIKKLHILLPERRAYIDQHAWSGDGEWLTLTISGSEIQRGRHWVQGASWVGKQKQYLGEAVNEGQVRFAVAPGATRLELVLMNDDERLFDRHAENNFPGYPSERSFLADRPRSGPGEHGLAQALQEGEGRTVEFKQWVDIKVPNNDLKAKFHQVVKTVVAFANTAGGAIYIGVDDNSSVVGVDEDIQAWGEAPPGNCIDAYCLALRTKIKNSVEGQVDLDVGHGLFESRRIIFVQVGVARHGAVTVQSEPYIFFRRVGGSNKKLRASEWSAPAPNRDFLGSPPFP
jgi:hypothetical protein